VQLIAGRLDQRCPVSDSIEAHEELLKLGKEVELVVYEDEGHTFLKLENVLDSEQRRVAFLAKYIEE
jgi:dipeptidyl aminopeptidase/acylaminoacyl peptidase